MRAFSNRIVLLTIGAAAFLAACGGGSDSKPGTVTLATMGSAKGALAAPASSWSSVKWGGGGYVSGLIYHPTSPNLLYARTDIGGAYRWNQSMSKWMPITDGLGFGGAESAFHGIESIALDPTNDQLVYMVAGMGGNGRLYASSNQGASWTWVALPFMVNGNADGRAIGERLRLDPTNPSTMFYGSRTAGLWKSSDSGHTWAQVTGLSSYTMSSTAIGVEQIIFDNGNVGGGQTTWNMWAAIAPDYANAAGLTSTFYRSSNGGFSWTPVAVPAAVAGYYIPHYARAADGLYYVVFNKNAGPGGDGPGYLYKYSGINGGVWTLLSSSTTGGYGGVSVYGSGSTARIALAVTNTWGDFAGQKITQLSDNAGSTWREIESQMPHTQTASGYWGWNDDVEIDPNNRDHIMHLDGAGIWETTSASSATPSWTVKVNNVEETATLAVTTPPAGATYKLINSAGDIGTWVQTDLATMPTKGPTTNWSNGNSADMSWSDPQYIAAVGAANWSGGGGYGYWSGDGGATWANFATLPAGAAADGREASNIVVTARNKAIWAPSNAVPSYTTDNGASWTATNLPALTVFGGWTRAYRLAVDRKNPNKVYAYDSGGVWWSGTPGKVYVSTDGGHSFTLSQGSVSAGLRANPWHATSLAVNPNVEGDVWLTDGDTVYHSVDSGATWTRLNNFASIFSNGNGWPDVQGASVVALGKAAAGAPYSAAVYVVGVINGQWGVWVSDNAGSTWTRFNDDAHQFGGIGAMAADWNTYGRIYVNGTGRGLLYSN
jgi:xyloglucan-specific exo-beta-1,4-glucanase